MCQEGLTETESQHFRYFLPNYRKVSGEGFPDGQRVKKCWKDIGEVCQDRGRMGKGPKMSRDHIKVRLSPLQIGTHILLTGFRLDFSS